MNMHFLSMVLCCLIPAAVLGAVLILGIPLSNVLFYALLLLCPLGHFFLMRGMMDGTGHSHEVQAKTISAETTIGESGEAAQVLPEKSNCH